MESERVGLGRAGGGEDRTTGVDRVVATVICRALIRARTGTQRAVTGADQGDELRAASPCGDMPRGNRSGLSETSSSVQASAAAEQIIMNSHVPHERIRTVS